MVNPLSIQIGQKITGKEINSWCYDQIFNDKSHKKDAQRLLNKNYNDQTVYRKSYGVGTGCGEIGRIEFVKEE
jgi:hypothetical protein